MNSDINSKKDFPNKNIFQKSNFYKMKKNLTFPDYTEKRCKRNLFIRNLDMLKTLNIYILINNILEFIDFKNNKIISNILRIPLLILNVYVILFISRINKLLNNKFFIRILIFISDKVNFVIFCKQNSSTKNDFFSLKIFNSIFISTIFLNYLFALNVNESISFYLIDSVILLCFHGYKKNYFFIRFFKNIFSFNLIYTMYYLFVSFTLQFIYEKSLRKLWALYDSFKRSFFMITEIFDEIQYGVIVVSKDLNTIFYKKYAVTKFYIRGNNINENRNSKKNKEITFKEIFNLDKNLQLEQLFISELKKANNYGINSFIFPLTNKFIFKENSYYHTLFKINQNENKNFMKINVYSSFWKDQIECYFIILNKNFFILNNSLQSYDRFYQINRETQVFLKNLNQICYKLTNTNKNNNNNNNNTNNNDNNNENNENVKITKKKSIKIKEYLNDSKPSINKSPSYDFEKKFEKSNYFKKMTDLFLKKNNSNQSNTNIDINFDYSFLFYIKYSCNYIYDLTLTDYVFNSLIENKYINENKFFNFNNFLYYIISYLDTFAKAKNFNIELKNILTENIYANYIYIRVLIFNIFFFILNNTKEKKEKTLEIKIEHLLFAPCGNYYGISFIFPDEYPKISYKKLSKFFSNFDILKFKSLNLYDLVNFVDYGLLVSFLISNTIFANNDKNLKNFNIEADNEKKIIIFATIYVPEKNKENIEKKFFNYYNNYYKQSDLLKKINEKIIEIQSQNLNEENDNDDYYEEKDKFENKYDNGKKDIFNENFEKYTLEEDKKLAFNININNILLKQNKYKSKEIKMENLIVQNMSCRLSHNKYKKNENKFQLLKNNNIKYSKTPRLLIIENKSFSSMGIIENLKEFKLKFLYEIVDDGKSGIRKFKDLIKTGFKFDFIFIDYELLKLLEIDILKKFREIESQFNFHTNIICLLDKINENKKEIKKNNENLIDDCFDKPINNEILKQLFIKHFKEVRKEKNVESFF